MSTPLLLAGVVRESIVDGPGIRFVVFAQGCPHHCQDCQNAQTWPFEGGNEVSPQKVLDEMHENPLLAGLTLSGGEPFCQSEAMADLAEAAKAVGYSVWAYTGYLFEELRKMSAEESAVRRLLQAVDVLVDGRFEREKMSYDLLFRGSSNQRLLDVPASLQAKIPIEKQMG
ncbi:MAG TPA: anaerobic ribonucleoside-triphosphate reductase activating protein [Ruminococcaceae bacterium]|nr:anaerobic ribonucleoside-triphosphate reductase activating protein [Oscillospiraceae bacterium]